MPGDRLRGKRRYLYRKKLLRRQGFLLDRLKSFHDLAVLPGTLRGSDSRMAVLEGLQDEARDLAHRMVRHGLEDQCLLLSYLVEEIMES